MYLQMFLRFSNTKWRLIYLANVFQRRRSRLGPLAIFLSFSQQTIKVGPSGSFPLYLPRLFAFCLLYYVMVIFVFCNLYVGPIFCI